MKTSIATVCISGNLPEKLEAIAKAGFDGSKFSSRILSRMTATRARWGI